MARVTKRARTTAAAQAPADKYFSKVIGKALDLLAALRHSGRPLSLNDLTQQAGLAKSSVFRMLYTLEATGYVQRDATGRYVVAPGVRAWGKEQFQHDLIALAMPHMRELSREFGETVSLAMRFDNRIEVVATIESAQLIRMANTVGRILPPHASSLGKAITAYQREEEVERLMRSYGITRFTTHTIVDEMELKAEFERVRERGYSTDLEESVLEGRCFGAPILAPAGDAPAALSVSLPKMRVRDKQTETRVITAVQRAAEQTTRDLAGLRSDAHGTHAMRG